VYIIHFLTKKGISEMDNFFEKFCRTAIFVPTQVLTCSGSKGIISAHIGTPKDIGTKIIKLCEKGTFF
jgi:hypothetical protein